MSNKLYYIGLVYCRTNLYKNLKLTKKNAYWIVRDFKTKLPKGWEFIINADNEITMIPKNLEVFTFYYDEEQVEVE